MRWIFNHLCKSKSRWRRVDHFFHSDIIFESFFSSQIHGHLNKRASIENRCSLSKQTPQLRLKSIQTNEFIEKLKGFILTIFFSSSVSREIIMQYYESIEITFTIIIIDCVGWKFLTDFTHFCVNDMHATSSYSALLSAKVACVRLR